MSYDGDPRMEALLVEYDRDTFLHERRVLAFPGLSVIVLTPHGDVYEEELRSHARAYFPTRVRTATPARYRNGDRAGQTVFFSGDYWERNRATLAIEWRRQYP